MKPIMIEIAERRLRQALEREDEKQALEALAAGADIDAKNKDGWTVLMQAVLVGSEKCVRFLLREGADANAKENRGETPLMLAAWANRGEIMQLLLAAGADLESRRKDGKNAEEIALSRRQETCAEMLKAAREAKMARALFEEEVGPARRSRNDGRNL